ncbi:MAG: hypothetical protein WCI21_05525 [Alphaproteobacteria bacterium]
MNLPTDRRLLIVGGVVLALVVAGLMVTLGSKKTPEPKDSGGGLIVEVGRDDKIDPNRQLPCYVAGKSIGMATQNQCAARNGLTAGQLDVGIDPSGELAFGQAGVNLAPLPPPDTVFEAKPLSPPVATPTPVITTPAPVVASKGPVAACWRFASGWTKLADMSLETCVQTLYDGRCEKAGDAAYGRWGEQTLRLVPGRVEQSPDNQNFRLLVRQGSNCSIPGL